MKCEFRLIIDVLFGLLEWDFPSRAMCPLTVIAGRGWGCNDIVLEEAELFKKKKKKVGSTPAISLYYACEFRASEHGPKHLKSHFAINRNIFNTGRHRCFMGLSLNIYLSEWEEGVGLL